MSVMDALQVALQFAARPGNVTMMAASRDIGTE
jgi:hypothetical protein